MQDITLSVIIPYYKEATRDIFAALASVGSQAGVDFAQIECVLVNDGGSALPDSFFAPLAPLGVRCVNLPENRGPGMARQAGIDASGGEYLMFIDADDVLHNALVLRAFLDAIEAGRPELVYSTTAMQWYTALGGFTYEYNEKKLQVMHGKAYKYRYLLEHNLCFHEALRLYEDSYFNGLVLACAKDVTNAEVTSYMRKYRADSLTRADDRSYFYETMPEYIDSIGYMLGALETRVPEKVQEYAVRFLLFLYFSFQKREWRAPENDAWRAAAERRFRERITPFIHYFDSASVEFVAEAYGRERQATFVGEIEEEPLAQWLEKMGRADVHGA